MIADGGFVLIYRRVLDDPDFRTEAEALAFVGLILKASWRDWTVHYKGQRLALKRGQLAISVRDLAVRLEWSKSRCERFISKLEKRDKIGTSAGTGVTVITIRKYDEYQALTDKRGTPLETEPRHLRDTCGTQNNQGNEGKEVREDSADAESPGADTLFPDLQAGDAEPAQMPCDKAVASWNRHAEQSGWKKVVKLTPARRSRLRLRLKEIGGLTFWELAMDRARRSELLGTGSPPTWWSFDFIAKNDTNIQKLMEGNYDHVRSGRAVVGPGGGGQRFGSSVVGAAARALARSEN